ncbi:hypothetical protein I3843_03G203800 [Carya illinoinensis]|nr:hypothetical protein I3843_03G203800 [Carya illinoinensis]
MDGYLQRWLSLSKRQQTTSAACMTDVGLHSLRPGNIATVAMSALSQTFTTRLAAHLLLLLLLLLLFMILLQQQSQRPFTTSAGIVT